MANVTKQLRVGQKVNLIDLEAGCRLAVADGDASALTITEAAADYLLLEDAAGEVTTRLPTYLVRGVTFPEGAAPVAETPVPVVEAVPVEAAPPVAAPVEEEAAGVSLMSEAA